MIDRETYQANIPNCCKLRTVAEHESDLMLCWGLMNQIKNGTVTKEQNCGLCEYNNLFTTEEYQNMWKAAVKRMTDDAELNAF